MHRTHSPSRSTLQRRSRIQAFTLVELVIAMAVAAVLAAIAIPAYSGYRERTRVSQAIVDIADMQVQIDRYQSLNFRLPDTLADAGLGGRVDPWGRAYQYLNIATGNPSNVRQDKNYKPLNSEYDLYSVGKDGVTHKKLDHNNSLDDVVRATDGSFIDLAEKF